MTQQINSATSMGRLMLNVLLSFAQFEREVTGERIRDKFAASKAKGMWMGGVVPIGYRVQDRKLVVVPDEAILVRRIFRDYLRYQGTTDLVRDLIAEGVVTKTGKPFSKQVIYKVIHNCLYVGEMPHKGKRFPGQHEPILDKALWDAVQAFVGTDERERRVATMTRNSPPALLKGLLYAPNGQRMVPSAVTKRVAGGKRYRYYIDNKNNRFGKGADTFGTLAAGQIEALVVEQVLGVLQSPATVQSVWDAVHSSGAQLDEPAVVLAMRNLAQVWNTLFPQEQSRIVNLLIERVQLTHESVEIEWRASGWASLANEFAPNSIGAEMAEVEEV